MSIYGYTLNFSLPLSNFDTPLWHEEDWNRWRTVDGLLASVTDVAPFTNATGTANTIVADYIPAITAYTQGLVISFRASAATTAAATVNVNGLGPKAIKFNGLDIDLNDFLAGSYVRLIYDGTNFLVIDPKKVTSQDKNIIKADSGCIPNAETDFYVESSDPTYMELMGLAISTQGYMFSRPDKSYAGGMVYDHVNNVASIYVDGNPVWTADEDGVTSESFNGNFNGPLVGNADTATALATARTIAYTGAVTGTFNFNGTANVSTALSITDDAVTNAKLANVPTATLKGRVAASTGDPEDLTVTQATAMLNAVVADTGSGGTKGLVPAPVAGDGSARKALLATGAFGYPVKAYGTFTGSTGAAVEAVGITCVRTEMGKFEWTITDPFPNSNYRIYVTGGGDVGGIYLNDIYTKTSSAFKTQIFLMSSGAPALADPALIYVMVF